MRDLPAALDAHIAGEALRLVRCWKVTRQDAQVFGFTSHDRNIVMDGVTGFLAGSTADWREALRRLEDAGLRRQLGRAGRERVVRDYSVARWTPDWVRVLEELTA